MQDTAAGERVHEVGRKVVEAVAGEAQLDQLRREAAGERRRQFVQRVAVEVE